MNRLFHNAVHVADYVISRVKSSDMNRPTPCDAWDVHDLMNHIYNELAWVGPIVEGKTIQEVGNSLDGDLVTEDYLGSWRKIAEVNLAKASLANPEAVAHLSYTDKTVDEYLSEVGGDIMVHSWDLAKGIGCECMLAEEDAQAIREQTAELMEGARESGLFAQPLDYTGNSTEMEKLLATFGRDINWGNETD